MTGMARVEIGDKMQVEVLYCVDEVINKLLAKVNTATIHHVLSESFQDRSETPWIMGNIVDRALARSIEREPLHDLIVEHLTKIVYTEDTFHVRTNNILRKRSFIAPVTRFVRCNMQKALNDLKASDTTKKAMENGSGPDGRRLVAVSLEQKPTFETLP